MISEAATGPYADSVQFLTIRAEPQRIPALFQMRCRLQRGVRLRARSLFVAVSRDIVPISYGLAMEPVFNTLYRN